MGELTPIFIASYEDGTYPEDNRILGCFRSSEKAQECIDKEFAYQHTLNLHPRNHHLDKYYYRINENLLQD